MQYGFYFKYSGEDFAFSVHDIPYTTLALAAALAKCTVQLVVLTFLLAPARDVNLW